MENLAAVAELNKQKQFVIFAPNHVSPNSKIRENLALAEDFPKLKELLQQYGLDSRVVFRGDGDIEVGKSRIMKMIYETHRKIFSALGRAVSGGIPLAINAKEPELAMRRNIPSIKEILKTTKKKNLTIYPYGNWFKSREQKYDEQPADTGFVPMKEFEKWRTSLKSGFVRIAKLTKAPIMPIYVDNTDGIWRFTFGELIWVDKKESNEEVAQRYLDQMKAGMNKGLLPEHKQ